MRPATAAPSLRDRIHAQVAELKMPGALEALDAILRQADGGTLSATQAVEQVLGAHIALRNARRLQTATRASRLPAIKTLADFDFSFQPSIKHEQIESLHTLGFIERKENVVFLGPPGVGMSHLALSLAVAAIEGGRRVYFSTLADLITSLEEAQVQGRLAHRVRTLVFPSLMLIDEIGYLPISRTGAMFFFQVMSRRYEHASTILTSNKGFEEWGRDLRRRGHGRGTHRPPGPPMPHCQHPRQQLLPAPEHGTLSATASRSPAQQRRTARSSRHAAGGARPPNGADTPEQCRIFNRPTCRIFGRR
jgi:DNA replication protein DnaC